MATYRRELLRDPKQRRIFVYCYRSFYHLPRDVYTDEEIIHLIDNHSNGAQMELSIVWRRELRKLRIREKARALSEWLVASHAKVGRIFRRNNAPKK